MFNAFAGIVMPSVDVADELEQAACFPNFNGNRPTHWQKRVIGLIASQKQVGAILASFSVMLLNISVRFTRLRDSRQLWDVCIASD